MKNNNLYFIILILPLFWAGCQTETKKVANTFREVNGRVSIEAEDYTFASGSWEEVEGRNAVTPEDAGLGTTEVQTNLMITGPEQLAANLQGLITLATQPLRMNWGISGSAAQQIAHIEGEPEKSAYFVYEPNSKMPELDAPGKRVAIFSGYPSLSEEGEKLFMAALNWSVDPDADTSLLVVSNSELEGTDLHVYQMLQSVSHQVQVIEDEDVTPEHAAGKSLVLVAESVSSGAVADKFRNTPVAVIICEPYILDDMGMVLQKPFWQPKKDQSGNAILTRQPEANHHLTYSIYFEQPGQYNAWILGQSSGHEPDQVGLNLSTAGFRQVQEFQSTTLPSRLTWTNASTVKIEKPGWYNLYLKQLSNSAQNQKYPGWRIDKILLTAENNTPEDDEISQTIRRDSTDVPVSLVENPRFLPPQVFDLTDGYVVAEAEAITHHEHWHLKTSPEGYSGSGYLEWQGPDRTVSIEGLGGNHDSLYVRQGPQNEWLIVRVNVTEPGRYKVNAQNIHQREDGDNDAWVNLVDFKPDPLQKEVISRMGDSHQDGKGFTWLDWGVREFELEAGINNIFIGGRSIGFGLDRIAIYKADDPEAERKALSIAAPEIDQNQ